jgi:hypothetical protein
MEARRSAIKSLMAHPAYFMLPQSQRLRFIRKLEAGLEASTAVFLLKAHNWVKTGKLE